MLRAVAAAGWPARRFSLAAAVNCLDSSSRLFASCAAPSYDGTGSAEQQQQQPSAAAVADSSAAAAQDAAPAPEVEQLRSHNADEDHDNRETAAQESSSRPPHARAAFRQQDDQRRGKRFDGPAGPSRSDDVIRIRHAPRHALPEDIVHFVNCPDIPVTIGDVHLAYDALMRRGFWYVDLKGVDPAKLETAFEVAYKKDQQRLGTKRLGIDRVPRREMEGALKAIPRDRIDRAVSVVSLPPETTVEDLERMFEGYDLDFHPVVLRKGGEQRGSYPNDRRAFVYFSSAVEAQRAARDRHRTFIVSRLTSVKPLHK
eukprot:jgi/Chlat1/1556/Chrsp122S00079